MLAKRTLIIYAVKAWQANENLHPLTCPNGHGKLQTYLDDKEVRLTCMDCDYTQDVPRTVVDAYID
jgi:hypothetical protein